MRKSFITTAFGLALLSLTAANAQTNQGYLGLGAGRGNIAVDCSDVPNCDKSSTGYKLYGGYRYASGWAFEGVYINWGKATASLTDTLAATGARSVALDASPITGTFDVELKATGFGLGVAYFMPMSSNWNGVARLGVMRNDGKVKFTASAKGMTDSWSESKKGTFAYFGFGVGYNLTPNLALTAEADFSRAKFQPPVIPGLFDAGDLESETDNVRLISIGLRYAF